MGKEDYPYCLYCEGKTVVIWNSGNQTAIYYCGNCQNSVLVNYGPKEEI